MNIGIEFFGFCLLLLSAILIGIWAYRGGHKGILLLQFFYATAGIIGMFRCHAVGEWQIRAQQSTLLVPTAALIIFWNI